MVFDLRFLRRLDWALLAAVLALCAFGLVIVYSATGAGEPVHLWRSGPPGPPAQKQALWMVIGLIAFLLTVAADYEKIARWHLPVYGGALALLVVVLVAGRAPTGASSWIALGSFRLQPSELAKIAVLLSLAAFLSRRFDAIGRWQVVLSSLVIAAAPVLLVVLQPDFGTAFVIIAIWFGALWLVGARVRHLGAVAVAGVALFALMWNLDRLLPESAPGAGAKVFSKLALRDYQKRRFTVFLNPQADPLGAGYHIIQSRVTVGSGQAFGRGLFRGTQSRLRFIPERHTDFIFSVIGEETGFAGSLAVVALFLFVFWRGLRIAMRARDAMGALLAAGAVSMLIVHTFVNIAMTVAIMPITGLPLPFISYGGSNLLASFIAFGLIQNVHTRRERVIL